MMQLNGLRKAFGRILALDGLSLTATDGAVTTLLGGNGSGKTTTLRILAGLIRPDSGTAKIDGFDVNRERAKALSRLGVLPDEFGLYARLTIREHVAYCGALHGLSGRALRRATDKAIERLGIQDIESRRAVGLSHGQRMKVALARAIVHEPRNLILDEPTRGLDIFALRSLRALIKSLRDDGVSILMSSHVMAEVAELSDEIVVIGEGRLLAAGPLSVILREGGASDLESAFVALAETQRKAA